MFLSKRFIPAFLVIAVNGKTREFHGLQGLGININQPQCATACRNAIWFNPLPCTPHDTGHSHGGHHSPDTSPQCFSSDPNFLTTLAWCIKQRCPDIEVWRIERFWREDSLSGRIDPIPPPPKWTYQESLANIEEPPKIPLRMGQPLNRTFLIADPTYDSVYRGGIGMESMEIAHAKSS